MTTNGNDGASDIDLTRRDTPNRYGRTPEQIEEVRARIADAELRAKEGRIRDDSEWGKRQLEQERRNVTAR